MQVLVVVIGDLDEVGISARVARIDRIVVIIVGGRDLVLRATRRGRGRFARGAFGRRGRGLRRGGLDDRLVTAGLVSCCRRRLVARRCLLARGAGRHLAVGATATASAS